MQQIVCIEHTREVRLSKLEALFSKWELFSHWKVYFGLGILFLLVKSLWHATVCLVSSQWALAANSQSNEQSLFSLISIRSNAFELICRSISRFPARHRLMYLINNTNSNFGPPNDVNGQCSNPHHFPHCNHPATTSPTSHPNHATNLSHHHDHHPNSHIRNSASYNCIVSNKPSTTGQIPHHSATNLAAASTANGALLCFNCKSHNHHSSSVNKLSNTSLATGSTNNIYNRNKLEQSLLEAKLRVAQLKKELQSSKLKTSNQYLNGSCSAGQAPGSQINGTVSASSGSISQAGSSEPQDQVDFGSFTATSRESQIRMLNSYMQEAVESVYGSQSNSRHSSQQQLALPLIKQGLSSSSISTDSLRNSTSSVHLNQPPGLSHNYHPYLQINHHQCNHQISTSDSCQSITENIYSNQQIINNLNKSKSANTINTINCGSSASNLANSTVSVSSNVANGRRPSVSRLENGRLEPIRQQAVKLKRDPDGSSEAGSAVDRRPAVTNSTNSTNCENYVIYSNQSAILAQQKQKQLEISQKIHHLHYDDQPAADDGHSLPTSNATATIDESFNLLSIIDKYYRKNDSAAVEVWAVVAGRQSRFDTSLTSIKKVYRIYQQRYSSRPAKSECVCAEEVNEFEGISKFSNFSKLFLKLRQSLTKLVFAILSRWYRYERSHAIADIIDKSVPNWSALFLLIICFHFAIIWRLPCLLERLSFGPNPDHRQSSGRPVHTAPNWPPKAW